MSRVDPVGEMSLSQVLPGLYSSGGGQQEPPMRRRGAARQQRKRKQRRRRRTLMVILLTLILIGGGAAGAFLGLAPLVKQLRAPKDYVGSGTGAVTVKIPEGASGRSIGLVLVDAGVVKTQSAFVGAANADPRGASVQPGTYSLHLKMSGKSALGMLLDPTSKLIRTVTLPEGIRAKDALDRIAKMLGMNRAALGEAATSGDIGLPKAADGKLEGFLYPATYDFEPGVTPTQVLTAMVDRGTQTYDKLGIPASQLRTDVIKASIVQAEAGKQMYMGRVARVIDNRLNLPMKLAMDSTVSYAVQKFNVTTTAADRASFSRYNTYRYAGLPAGPISNPGEDALNAVLHPTPGAWLYFVAVNPTTGETKFAVDEAGRVEITQEFQKWLQTHPQN